MDRSKHRRSSDVSIQDDEGVCRVDPTTDLGRRVQFIQLAGLPLLPVIALFIYLGVNLILEANHLTQVQELKTLVTQIESLVEDVVSQLLNEATAVVVYVGTNGTDFLGALSPLYIKTDEALEAFDWPEAGIAHYKTKAHFQASLARHRKGLLPDKLGREYVLREIQYYETVLGTISDWKSSVFDEASLGLNVWMALTTYVSLNKASTALAFERMLGTVYFVFGGLSNDLHVKYVGYNTISESTVEKAGQLYVDFKDQYQQAVSRMAEVESLYYAMAPYVYNNVPIETDLYAGIAWDRRTNYHIETLDRVRHDLLQVTVSMMEDISDDSTALISYYSIICIILIIGFLPYIILTSTKTTESLRIYSLMMHRNNQELRREKRKAERLLNQMLPRSVAEKLRRGHDVMAESFDSVTVYFSDIPDFSDISRISTPVEIVTFLNEVYRFMDDHIERYDVYKVETIGCVYMVVSGLPSRNGRRHVTEIARMSLDILENMEDFIIPHIKDREVKLRIGLSSGPCVAGVVGLRSPRYCLFGDTVNTAARMQTNGVTSKIHVTRSTYDLLKKQGGYKLEERGKVEIKGKGSMETFWLSGRVSDAVKDVAKHISNGSERGSDT